MTSTITWSQSKIFWQKQNTASNTIKENHKSLQKFQTFSLNVEALKQSLNGVAQRNNFSVNSNTILSFPNSEGKLERFSIKEASVMHPDLQARFPEIRSYAGQGIDNASSIIRFSITPNGFSGMLLSANGNNTFIEPASQGSNSYIVFNRSNRINRNDDFECSVTEQINQTLSTNYAQRNADDSILRTYRLAMSATGEYTQFHGGTKAQALAAIVTTMTRVNGIFEVDFNVTMVLIANTDDVIYTSTTSDPYSTTGSYNGELQSTLTSEIGEVNYDIGHLVANLQNNGNAGCIGCVCVNNQKGSGWTSATNPIGDFFDVDYVAHEMGHQFGANHTWTHGGNEGTNVQMEPGSGTTIMSYAGITGANTDVEQNVTPNFHAASIEQVTDYIKSTTCQTNTNTGNAVPVVSAGLNYTIPRGTAFVLDGSATDADTPSNALTYSWEQMDENNASSTIPSATATTGVAFRAYEPTTETNRYFPRLETIKTGATSWKWEVVPNVARTLNFRLTVRDNVAGGGTNNSDDVVVSVNGTAGPFVVNAPNTNVTWNAGTLQAVTWDVAGTTGNGVNTANVDIFLSIDGGDTYPISLASGVANDGSHDIVVPNNQGNQNRIMVRGSNTIFFDISDTDFTIGVPVVCVANVPTGLEASNVAAISTTLSWDEVTGAAYDLRYREVGNSTWITISVAALSSNITGLNPETDYEAQVRSKCNGGATSAYSSTVLFTTTAIPPCSGTQITTFPYLETFDAGLGDWTQVTGDDGDWILDDSGTPSGSTGPSDDITVGGNYLFLEASTNGSPGEIGENATAIFESPCFDLDGITEATLSFYYHMYGDDTGSIAVDISNDDGTSWVNMFSLSGDQGDVWIFKNIDLVAYLNQNIKLRFIGTTGGGFASDIAIDQIGIGDPIADAIIPVITLNGAAIINLSLGDTYTELGATATDNVDGDLTSSIVVGGDTVDTNQVGTYVVTYNVSDMAGNAAVEVTRTVNVTEYCGSSGNTSFETGITRVIFGTIDNVDGSPKDVGYEDFTNISTDAMQGTDVDLTIHIDTDGDFVVHAFVWIDWNQNGDFDDLGEAYDLGDIQNVADGALPTLTITIPESMNFGNTRMRVSAQYNADPTSCLNNFDGEVEDYMVNVTYNGLLFTNNGWIPNAPSDTTTPNNALILDGTYTIDSNIALNNLTVNNAAIIDVLGGESIELDGNLINNGDVILNSTSTQYSSLIVNGTVTGDVVYKRHVNVNASSGGNDLISAPVTGQTFGVFATANANIFSNPNTTTEKLFGPFDKATGSYLTYDTNVPSEASIVLNPGAGYRAASTDDSTFEFKGTVNTGAINIGVFNSGSTYQEWNLIGNPYPSYIKLSDFLSTNMSEFLSSSIAIYGYDGDTSNGWKIWNMAYAIANPNSIITPGQGFLVSSKSGGGTMVFNPSFRTIASGVPLLDDDFIDDRDVYSDDIAYLQLEMNSNLNSYSTDFYFTDLASTGLDLGFDASAFNGIAPDYAIYSHLVENSAGLDMSIQSVSYNDLNNNVVIPLGLNAAQGEQITVSISNTTLPSDVEVYLEDNLTNTFTLLNSNTYSFNADSNLSGIGRFYLRLETTSLGIQDNVLNSILVYAEANSKQIIIEGTLLNTTKAMLYDIQGREVLSQSLDEDKNYQAIDANTLSSGVYIITLQSTSGSISRKTIIK